MLWGGSLPTTTELLFLMVQWHHVISDNRQIRTSLSNWRTMELRALPQTAIGVVCTTAIICIMVKQEIQYYRSEENDVVIENFGMFNRSQ